MYNVTIKAAAHDMGCRIRKRYDYDSLLLVAVIVIGFLILSIPVLIVEWIIGKFSPMTKEISSLRLIQGAFKFILWVAGTKITVIGEGTA